MPSFLPTTFFVAMVDAIESLCDTHLHVVVDVPGRLEPQRLHRALELVAREVPELGSRFQRGWFRSGWVPDPAPRWVIQEHDAASSQEADALVHAAFGVPGQPVGALPVRLWLLHLPDRDRLVVRVAHFLADGGGTKNLCYRLAEACRGLAGDPGWTPPARPLPHAVWRLARAVRWRRLPAMLADIVSAVWHYRPLRVLSVPEGGSPSGPDDYVLLHLSAARVARLRERWRPLGYTLNDLAMVAWARAMEHAFPPPPGARCRLLATADLRRFAPPLLDVANFSTLRPFVVGRHPLPPGSEMLREAGRQTRAWKTADTGLMPALFLGLSTSWVPYGLWRGCFATVLRKLQRGPGVTALTNIGPIEAELLDFGAGPCHHACVLSPVAREGRLFVGALSGCNGALDFCIPFRIGLWRRETVLGFRDALDREIAALEHPPHELAGVGGRREEALVHGSYMEPGM